MKLISSWIFVLILLKALSGPITLAALGGIPPDFPPRLNVGITEPVGPTIDVEAIAGPKTESVDESRYSQIVYVSSSHGSDASGIGSATSPYASVRFAITQIEDATDLDLYALLVSSGFYPTTSPIEVPERSHIYGGFDPETWTRDIEEHETILAGGMMVSSVLVAADHTRLDGLIIQYGGREVSSTVDLGGGIHVVRNASATISNNTFRYNEASDGGGVFSDNNSVSIIRDNLFYGNSSPFGAAIYVGIGATTLITDNIIRDNTGEVGSSIFTSFGVQSVIIQNVVRNNSGVGISCVGGVTRITENLITDNEGNGIDFDGGSPSLISNNLILRNGNVGIFCDQRSRVKISGNLIVDNGGLGIDGNFNSITDIINNVVVGNSGVGFRGWEGGARNNVVVKNDSPFDGGGINWTSGTVTNNLVTSNHSTEQGGGIHARFVASVTITSNLVARNSTDWEGGGIYCNESNLLNNIVYRNRGPRGAGILCTKDMVTALNNLVLENVAQGSAGGILFGYNAEVSAANNLVYGNIANGMPNQIVRESREFSLTNSLVQGGFEGEAILDADPSLVGQLIAGGVASVTYFPDIAQTSILVSDPTLIPGSLDGRYIEIGSQGTAVVTNTTSEIRVWGDFVDDASGDSPSWRVPDFRLREDSPCIDAGLGPDALPQVPLEDLDGDLRSGQTCDIGADEFNGTYTLPTPLPTSTPTVTPTPTATITPTKQDYSEYDLHPVGGDGLIDARDLLEFLVERDQPVKSILPYAIIWKRSI